MKLLASNRSAQTRGYLNADGSNSVVYTAAATSYQDQHGTWQDIDNTLVKDAHGVWHTKANAWTASFGNATIYGVAITKGTSTFREIPQGANSVQPVVTKSGSDQLVTYKDLWNGVDLQYKVTGSAVKESIILHNKNVVPQFSFEYTGAGLTPVENSPGNYQLDGAFTGFEIAAPSISSRTMAVPQSGSLVTQSVHDSTITVSIDPSWLEQRLASAFPVVIDPTVFVAAIGSAYNNYSAGGLNCPPGPSCGNLIGHDATPGGDTWRALYQVAVPPSPGQYLVSAKLHVEMPSGSGNYGVTTPTAITVDHASCTNSFNCVDTSYGEVSGTVGTSVDLDLASVYQTAIANNNTSPWMIIRGDESSSDTFKYFDNTKTTVTFTYVTLPTQPTAVGNDAPADQGTSVSLQPVIDATGATNPDSGTGPLQYRYILGTGKNVPGNDPFHIQQGITGTIADSGLMSQNSWVVPPNVLQDGQTYYWQPAVWDSYAGAPQVYGQVYSFKVSLRNGKDATQASDTVGPASVDFATGNLSTGNGTHSTKALGGDLGLGLDYNTPQRSNRGLIGQYWNNPGGNLTFPATAPNFTRTDPNVSFSWGATGPYPGVISGNNYLVRWTGYFVAPIADTYAFGTTSVDRSRIFINGSQTAYADGWSANPTNLYGAPVTLAAGQIVPITYEYADVTGSASAQLLVKTTADNAIAPGPIPATMLQTGIQPIATPHGLIGHYYTDPGTHTFPADPSDPTRIFLTRTDPSLNLNWGLGSPVPGGPADNFLVRWTGYFTAPLTDTYTFGAGADDGERVVINGNNTIVNDWSDHGFRITYAASGISLTQGQTIPITIEYYEHGGNAQLTLYAKQASLPSAPNTPVNSTWLTPQTEVLPDGWNISLDAHGTVSYGFAVINQNSVTLYSSNGETHEYTYANGGFTPPVNESGHMVRNGDGTITLQDADGKTYIFNSDGTIKSVTSSVDDLNPAVLQYTYGTSNGSPVHLTQITDGVTAARWLKVLYSGDSSCPAAPSGFLSAPPAGMICAATTNDGRVTSFFYAADPGGTPRLARIVKPGSETTDYGYDAAGRIIQVRDSLANDAVSAGIRSQDGTEVTQIAYDALGRATSVTLPAATAGATRIAHTYQYLPNNTTLMHVTNATEPNGFTRKITFDGTYRTLTDTDIANLTATTVWDPAKDLMLSTTDPAGFMTTHLYDYGDRETDSYGPAPSAWYGSNRIPTSTYTAQVPHQQTAYDQNIPGLATAYYNVTTAANGTGSTTKVLFGSPKAHATGIGPANGDVVQTWNGTPPFTPDAGDGWGARLSGDINLAGAGNYTFRIYSNDGVRLWIDDALVVNDWNDGAPRSHTTGQFNNANANSWHRVRLDYYNAYGHSNATLQLYMTPPGGTETSALGSLLTPMYGLKTTQTTYDSSASVGNTVTVSNYGSHPELSLVQSSTVDPTGLNLTTSYAYETQGAAGSFMRQTSKTLPGGAVTSYTYYAAADTRQNPCNTSQTFLQAGMLKLTTDPTGVTTENVYDDAGRVVATRINADPWKCTTYDTRGRVSQVSIPALANTQHVTRSARTINYDYAYAGNPLRTDISDSEGSVNLTKDLLGRTAYYLEGQFTNPSIEVFDSTSYTYDTIGRLTTKSGAETETYGYDTFNRLSSVSYNGSLMASPSYDAYSRLQQVTYPAAGQQKLVLSRDNLGRVNVRNYTLGDGTTTVADSVAFSQSGQVVSGTENGAAKTYTYDKADRLTNAALGTNTFAYNYAAPSSATCNQSGVNLNAQKDSNITSQTINGTTTTFCYDGADRLIASSNTSFTAPIYDTHANLAGSGSFTKVEYDSSDRAVYIADTGGIFKTTFDPLDRRVYDSTDGYYYGYTDNSDTPSFTHDSSGFSVGEYYLRLPGGVQATVSGSGSVQSYSLPNLHGDTFATTSRTGGTLRTFNYEPFGKPISTSAPNNTMSLVDNAWLGQYGKGTDTNLTNKFIQMGARLYIPTLGRFTQVDSVEGGNANAYVYPGDPVNQNDLTGQCLPECAIALGWLAVRAYPYIYEGLQGLNDSFSGASSTPLQGGEATSLREQLALQEAKSVAPSRTERLLVGKIKDPRFPESIGWRKLQYIHEPLTEVRGRGIVIHYFYNSVTKSVWQLKVK